MEDVIFIEGVLFGTTHGVMMNLHEISSYSGDGRKTIVRMKDGTSYTLRSSFEEFGQKLWKAGELL